MKTIDNFSQTNKMIEQYQKNGTTISVEEAKAKINQRRKNISDKLKQAIADKDELKIIFDVLRESNGNYSRSIENLEQMKADEINTLEENVKNGKIDRYSYIDSMDAIDQKYEIRKEKFELIRQDVMERARKGEVKGWNKLEEEYMAESQTKIDKLNERKTDFENKYNEMPDEELVTEVTRQTIENETKEIYNEIMQEEAKRGEMLQAYSIDEDKIAVLRDNIEQLTQRKDEYNNFLNEYINSRNTKENVQKQKSFWKNVQNKIKSAVEKIKGVFRKPKPMLEAPKEVKEVGVKFEDFIDNKGSSRKEFMDNIKVEDYKAPATNKPTIQITTHNNEKTNEENENVI